MEVPHKKDGMETGSEVSVPGSSDFDGEVVSNPIPVGAIVERDVIAEFLEDEIGDRGAKPAAAIRHDRIGGSYTGAFKQVRYFGFARKVALRTGDQLTPHHVFCTRQMARLVIHVACTSELFDAAGVQQLER